MDRGPTQAVANAGLGSLEVLLGRKRRTFKYYKAQNDICICFRFVFMSCFMIRAMPMFIMFSWLP